MLPIILCDGIMNKDMDCTFDLFLVNPYKIHRTSFIKQTYVTEITGTLINP